MVPYSHLRKVAVCATTNVEKEISRHLLVGDVFHVLPVCVCFFFSLNDTVPTNT